MFIWYSIGFLFIQSFYRYEMNIFNIIHHYHYQSRLPRTIIRIDSIMHFKATIPSLSIHLYDSIISKLQFHHFQYIYSYMVYTHTFICIRITQFELFKPHPWLTRWNHVYVSINDFIILLAYYTVVSSH